MRARLILTAVLVSVVAVLLAWPSKAIASLPSSFHDPVAVAPPVVIEAPTYTVVAGDNLSQLATDAATSVAGLVELNKITDPDLIYVGEVLTLPVGSSIPVHVAVIQSKRVLKTTPHGYITSSPVGGSSSFEQCVIARESGGNAQIWNASGHWGAFQFSRGTWIANGGNPATFGSASFAEQQVVFVHSAPSNWSPYDNCTP